MFGLSTKTGLLQIIQNQQKTAVKNSKTKNYRESKDQTGNLQILKPFEKGLLLWNGADSPRCRFKDSTNIQHKKGHTRTKRFHFQGSRWQQDVITYSITSYSKKLTKAEVNKTVAMAFRMWAEVIPLIFRWSSHADVEISFTRGKIKILNIFHLATVHFYEGDIRTIKVGGGAMENVGG